MNLAVFGDMHGKILLAWLLCRRWQDEHGDVIDAILSVGDVGIFPSEERMDKATRRLAQKYRIEAGFMDHFATSGKKTVESVLSDVKADMFFVRGNHEDFDFLEELIGPNPEPKAVDAYGRLIYLPDGARKEIRAGSERLVVTALGGIARGSRREEGRHKLAFMQKEGLGRLKRPGLSADVLLTHEPALRRVPREFGSADLFDLLKILSPQFHFSGHMHEWLGEYKVGATRSYGLAELGFKDDGSLIEGGFGVLRWSDSTGGFEPVTDDWLRQVRVQTWQYIL